MQLTARYTAQSVQEATQLNRRLWRRALGLATSARAFIYLIAALWIGFGLLLRGFRATPARPSDIASGALVLFLTAAGVWFVSWRQTAKIRKALRAQPDQRLTFDHSGVTTTEPTGASTFEPWSAFQSFREGKYLVALARSGKAPARAIPTDALTPAQAGELRSILLSNLPERL